MRRTLLLLITVAVLLLTGQGTPALAGPEVGGGGGELNARDGREDTSTTVHIPGTGKAPPTVKGKGRGTKGTGTKGRGTKGRIAERGSGDKPAPVNLGVNEYGAFPCVEGGGTFTMADPLIEVPETVTVPDCTGAAGPAKNGQPPRPIAREAAFEAWYWATELPDPSLATSPPNGAITGLDLYLAIGGPQSLTLDVPALGYVVHFEVTSVYDVDWGDPRPDDSVTGRSVTRNHPTQGGLYPVGDLRHQYIDRGEVTIEVVQKWTARWSAEGESGILADRLATSSTVTIPVQEIQAVITG